MKVRSFSLPMLCLLGVFAGVSDGRCASAVNDSTFLRAWNGISGSAIAEHVPAAAKPASTGSAPAESTDAQRMFQRMGALVGDWEGTYEWSGARKGSGDLKVTYSSSGFGSALLETLIQGGVPSMTTVYHLDGADLRMTHYCAARNQPRLKATRIDSHGGAADFGFVDVTGSTAHGYVEGMELRIQDPDRLHIRFVFGGSAARSYEDISLQRVRRAVG